MKIVVIDGHTMNPGDLDWGPLQNLGACEIYERSAAEEIMPRLQDAEIVITNKVAFNRERMQALPNLKYIGVSATGYNIIDCVAAKDLGITVTNVPAYSTTSVAQLVFAFVLAFYARVAEHDQTVRQQWPPSPDFCYWNMPLTECQGKTFGIIGMGEIGRRVAQIATVFGMQVIFSMHRQVEDAPAGCSQVALTDLFSRSDIISLHCPLTPQTEKIINSENLQLMKKTAILINTGRGPLLDEHAVAQALNRDEIGGLGADVLSSEPPAADNPLLHAKNCIITPHLAWATRASRQRLLNTIISNIQAYQSGSPVNRVA